MNSAFYRARAAKREAKSIRLRRHVERSGGGMIELQEGLRFLADILAEAADADRDRAALAKLSEIPFNVR